MTLSFGYSEFARIDIDVGGYSNTVTGEHWDDNWLNAEVTVRAGGFSGRISTSLTPSELTGFLSELRILYQSLSGTASLTTLEDLSLRLTGDGIGHIHLRGEVRDQPGVGNQLSFTIELDQTDLKASLFQLEQVVRQFPERSA